MSNYLQFELIEPTAKEEAKKAIQLALSGQIPKISSWEVFEEVVYLLDEEHKDKDIEFFRCDRKGDGSRKKVSVNFQEAIIAVKNNIELRPIRLLSQ